MVSLVTPAPAIANITSCADSEVTPHAVLPGSTTTFNVRIRNTDINEIAWIDIFRPTAQLEITGAEFNEWDVDYDAERVSLRGTSISNGQSTLGTITARAANTTTSSANWVIKVSDTFEGENQFFCGGSLGFSILGELQDEFPPHFSNIRLSSLTHNSVTIKWNSDEPATTVLNYGISEDYGLTKTDNTLKTNHSVSLSDLSPETGYFFEVSGADAAGNYGYGDAGTFLTAVKPPNQPTIIQQNLVNTPVSLTPGKESTPPQITLSTNLEGIYREIPEIAGTATDNDVLAKIEYSTNGGISWQVVDTVTGLGGKRAIFSFSPKVTEDGNFTVQARAIDAALNVAVSDPQTLVVDTGPPVVGGVVLTSGATLLVPNSNGESTTMTGIDQRIIVNAAGGPTEIVLKTESTGSKSSAKSSQLFHLTRSAETGLWSGVTNFKSPGRYNLVADSIDGAGNMSVKTISKVLVLPPGTITKSGAADTLEGVEVTLFTFEPTTKSWVVWDGAPYGQQNPQLTNKAGQYGLLVPSGKYYLEVKGEGFQRARSQIFNLSESLPVAVSVGIKQRASLKLGKFQIRLPEFRVNNFEVKFESGQGLAGTAQNSLPTFDLATTSGTNVKTVELLGKPTVITVLNTWAPAAREQLPILDELDQEYEEINIVPVFLLESASLLSAYQKIGGYQLNLVSDKNGVLAKSLNSGNIPAHYLVDRKGVIQKTIMGVLSKEELFKELTSL